MATSLTTGRGTAQRFIRIEEHELGHLIDSVQDRIDSLEEVIADDHQYGVNREECAAKVAECAELLRKLED